MAACGPGSTKIAIMTDDILIFDASSGRALTSLSAHIGASPMSEAMISSNCWQDDDTYITLCKSPYGHGPTQTHHRLAVSLFSMAILLS